MIIKELNLIGFGKFENKRINLEDGINIIYGENEKGKTTIHNFINGMFYGFLKPYVKRTIYLDEHERYNPWDSSKYSGTIKFSYDGEDYQIQREFTKNNESTKVLVDTTGEDITNSIDNGNSGRVLQPGNHFLGFNNGVYSNTISIKQLENQTEELLANEVKDKLVNMSTTRDDKLSVEKATDNLEDSLKDIGTIRATKSLYGRIYESLEEDKKEREYILSQRQEYKSVLEKKEDLEKELNLQNQELKTLKKSLKRAEIYNKKQIYKEALKLQKDIKEIQNNIDKYKKYRELDDNAYLNAIQINDKIENLREKISENRENLKKLSNKKINFTSEQGCNSKEQEIIIDKFIEYENLDEEKEKFNNRENANHLEFLKRDFDYNKKSKDKYKSTLGITIFVLIASILGSIFLNNYLFLSINFLSIPLGIFSSLRFKEKKEIVNKLKREINEGEEKEEKNKDLLLKIEKKQREILHSLDLDSKSELKKLQQKIQIKIFQKEDRRENLENINREIERTENLILNLNKNIDENRENLKNILKENLSTSLEDLKDVLKYKKTYEDAEKNIKNKNEILNRVLKDNTMEDLKIEIQSYKDEDLSEDELKSIDEIKKDIDKKQEEISNTRIQKSALEERLNYLNKKIDKLVEVEETIIEKENRLYSLDKKRESLDLAINTLKDLSKDIHKEFAPKLNDTVGSIVEDITGGKYLNVKVNDKLELGVVRPETREIVDIKSLSGGTIDQLYFALRFGIIDSFNRKTLPLILDDCFIQYDDTRLENIMKFLIRKSKDRQIVLFTCHKRELELLKKLNLKFNLIDLS